MTTPTGVDPQHVREAHKALASNIPPKPHTQGSATTTQASTTADNGLTSRDRVGLDLFGGEATHTWPLLSQFLRLFH